MDRQVLLRKIMKAGDEVRRLEQDLIALQSVDIVGYPDNYSSLSHRAVIKSEYITHKIRELVYSTTSASKWSALLGGAVAELGITVTQDSGGVVNITIPCLVPGRKKKPTEFITVPLYTALESFIVKKITGRQPFKRFTHCVICIIHVYDKLLIEKGRARDYDNIELKGIVDVINTFLLADDSGFYCSVFNTSEFSDRDFTRISVMERDMFCKWVLDMKNV